MQNNIIKELNAGKKLTENEKRYLRGNLREKLIVLEELKQNGYGWYFKTKVIEVINTRIGGIVRIADNIFKFIRVKSIGSSDYSIDKKTGLKYATNDQILNDSKLTKNEYVKNVWMQMLSRYRKLFVKNYNKFKDLLPEEKTIDYENERVSN